MEDSSDGSDEESYGPALPPHLRNQTSEEDVAIGPVLPPIDVKISSSNSDTCPILGPALPPNTNRIQATDTVENNYVSRHIGPMMPPNFNSSHTDDHTNVTDNENEEESGENKFDDHVGKDEPSDCLGPALPPGYGNGATDDTIGPVPSEMSSGQRSSAVEEFEERARKMKGLLTGEINDGDAPTERETWMTELPSSFNKTAGLNLTTRGFRKREMTEVDQDRSGWTDTPVDKKRKEEEKGKSKTDYTQYRKTSSTTETQHGHKESKKHKKSKHKDESLLERHQKKMKKKKKKEKVKEKTTGRRPFDRDVDLKVNRFDDAQRKALIKKSAELNTKFKHAGSTSSFL